MVDSYETKRNNLRGIEKAGKHLRHRAKSFISIRVGMRMADLSGMEDFRELRF